MPDLRATDPVRIVNKTDRDFRCRFRGDTYLLEAGAQQMWPWQVACYLLGNPNLVNTPKSNDADYTRLSAMRKLAPPESDYYLEVPAWDEWSKIKPDIETYDMAGERILMAFETEHNREQFRTGYTEDEMKVRVAQLEQQLANFQASMEGKGELPFVKTESVPEEQTVASEDGLPVDSNTTAGRGRKADSEDSFAPPAAS